MSTVISAGTPQSSAADRIVTPASAPAGRLVSIDILRGLVMVIMALDHTRDFFTRLRFEPETLAKTYYALFFTRWITHFCAPLFFFLAGTGVYLYGRRHSIDEVSRFLWTRGLWLMILEFTVVGTGWSFLIPFGFFGVIWALGACMVLTAAIVRLPIRWVAGISIVAIASHDLLDHIRPQQFGSLAWVWSLLHVRGPVMLPFHAQQFVLFPIIPWVFVMSAGYAFGAVYQMEADRRRKFIRNLGLWLTVMFILLRVTNLYGNPPAGFGGVSQGDWHVQPTLEKTIILFFDVEKYPPSLQFLLMTLGPSFLLLAWLEKKNAGPKLSPMLSALLIFGRVPLFYYVLHLYTIHVLAIAMAALFHFPVAWLWHGGFFRGAPDNWGFGLPFIYLMWFTAVAILYLPCRWFAGVKQRHKTWWLSYL